MYRLKVQHILYLIAVVFGVIGFLNFQSSMRTSSYEKVSGYITDVEETSELTKADISQDIIILFIGSVMVRNINELYMKHYRSRMSPQQSFGQAWIIQTL